MKFDLENFSYIGTTITNAHFAIAPNDRRWKARDFKRPDLAGLHLSGRVQSEQRNRSFS
jgi:hypothetical protein